MRWQIALVLALDLLGCGGTAVIDAALKYLGGPTIPASSTLPADAYFSRKAVTVDWPHFWSV